MLKDFRAQRAGCASGTWMQSAHACRDNCRFAAAVHRQAHV
jgi:hypothetical protein